MKRILLVIALIITTICLSACDCGGKRHKAIGYECTYWMETTGTTGLDILKNEDGTDVFSYYNLYFFENGSFVLRYKLTTDSTYTDYTGTYVDKDGSRYLTYENKPDELQGLFGASVYKINSDKNTLTRKQSQINPSTGINKIVNQTFEKIK